MQSFISSCPYISAMEIRKPKTTTTERFRLRPSVMIPSVSAFFFSPSPRRQEVSNQEIVTRKRLHTRWSTLKSRHKTLLSTGSSSFLRAPRAREPTPCAVDLDPPTDSSKMKTQEDGNTQCEAMPSFHSPVRRSSRTPHTSP